MLGAAVWQDRQGTTANSDESPRERPPQPPPRHGAAALPMEPAGESAPEPGEGRRQAGAGAGPRRGRRPERAARGGDARIARRGPSLPVRSRRGLDPGPTLVANARLWVWPSEGPWKHLWGQSLEGGRRGRDGTLQATIPACAPGRARRWGNNAECGARRPPAPTLPSGMGWLLGSQESGMGVEEASAPALRNHNMRRNERPSQMTLKVKKAAHRHYLSVGSACGDPAVWP